MQGSPIALSRDLDMRFNAITESMREGLSYGCGDAVIEYLHEDTAQCRVRVDLSDDDGRGSNSEETEHAVPKVVDRQIGNHPFQI